MPGWGPIHSLDRPFSRHDPMLVYDLETTGVDPETDRIVSTCVALVPRDMGDGRGRPPKVFSRYVNPGIEIPQESIDVHGLTSEWLAQHGVEPAVAIEEVAGLLRLAVEYGIPIVGANLRFDLTFIDRECQRHGIRPVAERPEDLRPVIDVQVIDKAADPYRKKRRMPDGTEGSTRTLAGLCDHWGVKLEGAHDSTVDALATGRILFKMARGPMPRAASQRPYDTPPLDISAMKIGELHDRQVEWAAKQAKSLATFFRRIAGEQTDPAERQALLDKADGCRPEWPFIPRPMVPEAQQESLW